MQPDVYCEQKAAQSGSSFYRSFRFLPQARRRAIVALYAFCREVDDIVDETGDVGVARIKLAWWRGQVAAIFGGVPQHPVAQALQPVVAEFGLPESRLQAVIDGMAMDLEQQRYLDFAMLERYCDLVAGGVGLMSAEIFGYSDPATRVYARDLGIAFQLTNIIRDVGEDARRGRIYLPQAELDRYGVTASDILGARHTPRFVALMRFQVARARTVYQRALSSLPSADRRAQRPGLIMAAIYRALLNTIERDGFHVLDRRAALSPLRKAWIAWTASWSY
ncbi:MAG TPA: presqualene diphosphate synthase HpnD [Casimicrobiaceae bacterium]|jgi:phytoene synthase